MRLHPWRFSVLSVLLLASLLLAACRPAPAANEPEGSSQGAPASATLFLTPEVGRNANSLLPEGTPAQAAGILPVQVLLATPIPQASPPLQQPSAAPSTEPFRMCSPLEPHPLSELPKIVSAPYKPPPKGHEEERHHGVDFAYYRLGGRASILGVGIQSVLAGKVAMALNDKFPYGNAVIVETPRASLPDALAAQLGMGEDEALYVLYAHLQEPPVVKLGEAVAACQPLGQVGQSGNAGVPHLHLETRLGPAGHSFSSMLFYSTSATVEEMENYKLWRTSGEFRHFDPMILLLSSADQ